ncbi:hypothetical protein AAHA92_22584 [Salvia divinorum]|uniref:Uncharacterized protein n=1 Tax=Salvia divinorum TaxID=28513 RepID=A0ABD1GPH2_SALDI
MKITRESLQEVFGKAKPFLAVVFLQAGLAGMDIISKAALNEGMSNYVFVVYRHPRHHPFCLHPRQKNKAKNDYSYVPQDNANEYFGACYRPKSLLLGDEVHDSDFCSCNGKHSSGNYICNGMVLQG